MSFKFNLPAMLATTFAVVLCFALTAEAQTTYEASASNTELQTWWDAGDPTALPPRLGIAWDSPFGTSTATLPGSLLNGTGATDDGIIIGRFAPLTTQYSAQIYRGVNATPVGEIGHVQIGSANQTLAPVFSGARQNAQIQLQVQNALTINANAAGESVLYGVNQSQGGIQVNNANGVLNIRGDLNFDPSNRNAATAGTTSWPVSNTATTTPGSSVTTGTIVLPHFVRMTNGSLNLGGNINGADAISLQLDRGTFIMDTTGDGVTDSGAQTFNVNSFNIGAQTNANVDYVVEHTIGAGKTINAWFSEIGKRTNANSGIMDATLNLVDGGSLDVRSMNIGMVAGSAANVVPAGSANGTVNVGNGSVLSVGRENTVTAPGLYGGNLVIGNNNANQAANAGGTGTLNINNGGVVNSRASVQVGGENTTGLDALSSGTLNVNSGGILNVGQVSQNSKNLEVGRGGEGTMSVNGGAVNIGWGNFVLGQSTTAEDPTQIPPRPAIPNNARGTVVFDQGATIVVGDDAVNGTANSDFNFNKGGGDVTHTGAGTTVTIEQNINFQDALAATDGAASLNANSSYSIDNGTLTVGNNMNSRSNLAGTNTFRVGGDQATITVGNNLNFSTEGGVLEFDFMGGTSVSSIDIAANANIADGANGTAADLTITGAPATYTGDIVLLDVTGVTNGVFGNAPANTLYGGYQLVYDYDAVAGSAGGGQSVALIQGGPVTLACDLDSDGDCDNDDIVLLYAGSPTSTDIVNWLTDASGANNPAKLDIADMYVLGDVNLDGDVNSTDLGILLNNFGDPVTGTPFGWAGGDLNADGMVDSTDLGQQLNNFNFTSAAAVSAVPEPSALALMLMSCLGVLGLARRRR